MFVKIVILKNLQILKESTSVGVFLMKLQAPRTATLWKRDSNTGFFLWNLLKFLRTPCFTEHLQWLFWQFQVYSLQLY